MFEIIKTSSEAEPTVGQSNILPQLSATATKDSRDISNMAESQPVPFTPPPAFSDPTIQSNDLAMTYAPISNPFTQPQPQPQPQPDLAIDFPALQCPPLQVRPVEVVHYREDAAYLASANLGPSIFPRMNKNIKFRVTCESF
jgi:hypothetical protein